MRAYFGRCCSTSGVSLRVCEYARSPVQQLETSFRHAPMPPSSHSQKLSATSGQGSVLKCRSYQRHPQNARKTFFSSEPSWKLSVNGHQERYISSLCYIYSYTRLGPNSASDSYKILKDDGICYTVMLRGLCLCQES